MSCITVTTQADLDKALADRATCIHIESKRGVWLTVRDSDSSSVEARGSSSVEARDSSSVVAWDSSSVVARDSSSVVAWDSSSVEAWGSSSVEAWDSSSVVARDSSSVEAWGSSSVVAWDSSSVVARGSSSVVARGSSSVVARGSSSVEARGASNVHCYGGTVTAGAHVAVHLHSGQAAVQGGVVIDLTTLDLTDPATWCGHHGVTVREDGTAVLFKAVDEELAAGHGYKRTTYPIGGEVTAADWRDDHECGGGLHVSPHPVMAAAYCHAAGKRVLRVVAPVGSLRPIGADKCKAPLVRVECEVDRHGRELATVDSGGVS